MKQSYNDAILRMAVSMALVSSAGIAALASPAAPVGVKAEILGTRVDLSWANGDAGTPLLECGFEEEDFPGPQWSAKVTNDYRYLCSWFRFPGPDFSQTTNYTDYIHSGDASAMMYFDMYGMSGDHDAAQDEWLITPKVEGASYLELYYFMDPTILEYGAEEAFPDHYYVRASYDDGTEWETLWDARTGTDPEIGWHSLALPLKNSSPVKVAFQGVSDTGEMVHFLWAIDDVKISPSVSGTDIVEGYTIKLDGETIAEHLTTLEYTDLSPKTPGTHRYEIFAESGNSLSPAAVTEVTVADIKMLPPRNLKVDSRYDEDGESYIIALSWEAPETDFRPSSYNVYCDGIEVGTQLEETSIEYYGYTKGIYDFRITAVYSNPDGESEAIAQRVAIDTRYNAHGLKAVADGNNVVLSWNAPEENSDDVSHYEVWRGDKQLNDNVTGLSITDAAVPAGVFRYYVTAVFSDGEKALPAYLDYDNGTAAPRAIPFAENFNTGFLPSDWTIVNLWDQTPENLLWQLDDPNGLGVNGDGFDGGFASIDCINSGFYSLDSAIQTPSINIGDCDIDNLMLSFAYDYASDGFDSVASLEIELDGDENWQTLLELESYDPENDPENFYPEIAEINLYDYVGDAEAIRLRWHYVGMLDYYLAIDNVLLTDGSSAVRNIQASDGISIHATSNGIEAEAAEGLKNISIYSTDGRLVKEVSGAGSQRITIPFNLQGIYMVRATTESGNRTVKIRK